VGNLVADLCCIGCHRRRARGVVHVVAGPKGFFGPLREPPHRENHTINDLGLREISALAPLAIFVVWIGVCPNFFLRPMERSVSMTIAAATRQFDEPRLEKRDDPGPERDRLTSVKRMKRAGEMHRMNLRAQADGSGRAAMESFDEVQTNEESIHNAL